MSTAPPAAAPDAVLAPLWRRARFWVALAAAGVLGAVLLGALADSPGRRLDPGSADPGGSRALARLLAGYGGRVTTTSSLATAASGRAGTVLVTDPDAYSSAQLRRLRADAARVVLVRPGTRAVRVFLPGLSPRPDAPVAAAPGCGDPGMTAAGRADWPGDVRAYRGAVATSCFGGAVTLTRRVVVLGSANALRNDSLARAGLAAVAVNAIGTAPVTWLLPGPDADGDGPASVWDLFPAGAYRVFWWLVAVGVLTALWRARRLGPVVSEPLPVVVRSAELVEGHGRLYARGGASDRAAHALRAAAVRRLAARLALPRGTATARVITALAPRVGRPPAEVAALLAGAAPAGDTALVHLARDLDRLEADLPNEGNR